MRTGHASVIDFINAGSLVALTLFSLRGHVSDCDFYIFMIGLPQGRLGGKKGENRSGATVWARGSRTQILISVSGCSDRKYLVKKSDEAASCLSVRSFFNLAAWVEGPCLGTLGTVELLLAFASATEADFLFL